MGKFLSIVVPRFSESKWEIFPLLSGIDSQLGIDFGDVEIVIANDGGGAGELDESFLSMFRNLEIRQVQLNENRGPGMARQAGIDAAKGLYIMFCDADDVLHSVGVLGAVMQEAERSCPDILVTSWIEELKGADGRCSYITHAGENTWMHGKLIRRQFLENNGIRHHPGLRVHEDSYILSVASALAERRKELGITSYVWKFNPDSITRRDGASYTFRFFPEFVFACCESYKVIDARRPDLMEYKVVQLALYCYFVLHTPAWQAPANRDSLSAAEKALIENISPFWKYWKNANPERVIQIYNEERAKHFKGCIEQETLNGWIVRLGIG